MGHLALCQLGTHHQLQRSGDVVGEKMRPKDTVGSETKLWPSSNSAVETLCPALNYYRPQTLRLPEAPSLCLKHRRVAGIPVPAFLYYSCLPSAASRDLAQRSGFARKDKAPTPDLACVLPLVPERTMTKACCSWPCAGSPTSSSSGKGDQPLVGLQQVRFTVFLPVPSCDAARA